MSQFFGRQFKGAARSVRDSKRVEAKQRQASFDAEVEVLSKTNNLSEAAARQLANETASSARGHRVTGATTWS